MLSGFPLEHGTNHRLTPAEQKRLQECESSWEAMAEERFWNKKPDDIALKRPTETKKVSVFVPARFCVSCMLRTCSFDGQLVTKKSEANFKSFGKA